MVSLSAIGILADLDEEALSDVERHVNRKKYNAGEELIEPESDSSDVYLIVSGKVKIVNYSLSGREITLEEICTGGCVGHLAAIDRKPRSACVIAKEDTEVAILSPSKFELVVRSHPSVAWYVIKELARIVRRSTRRIVDVSTLGANERVIAEILRFAQDEMREDGRAMIKPVPVHSDIASKVSTSRETVARVLSNLARRRLIERVPGALHVPNVHQLESFLDEMIG